MYTGRLIALILAFLFTLYLFFAATHDISRADETDYSLEYTVLVLTVPAFFFIHRSAMKILPPKPRLAWLVGAACVLALLEAAALNVRLHPKYPNDSAVGTWFLTLTLPVFAWLCWRTARAASAARR